jgi:hypothetical protein
MHASSRSLAVIAGTILCMVSSPSRAGEPERTNNREEWKLTRQRDENRIQEPSRWKDVVGHRVAVEGLLWGSGKGLDPHIILHGGLVYIEQGHRADRNGKPVRVVGVLTLRHIKKAPPDVQGYNYDFDAFIVESDEEKILDRVTWPWMEDLGKPTKK